jgi:hypothetical protein
MRDNRAYVQSGHADVTGRYLDGALREVQAAIAVCTWEKGDDPNPAWFLWREVEKGIIAAMARLNEVVVRGV